MEREEQERKTARSRRRLRGFGYHLLAYMVVMSLAVPINMFTDPENPWFVFPLVGWGAPLAIHAAFAMGLLDRLRPDK